MSKLEFTENINNNKISCGNFHFSNDMNISIFDSNFNDNYSKSSGGAMYELFIIMNENKIKIN